MRLVDDASQEQDGKRMLNGKLAVGERDRAVAEERLEEALVRVESLDLEEEAEDVGIVAAAPPTPMVSCRWRRES